MSVPTIQDQGVAGPSDLQRLEQIELAQMLIRLLDNRLRAMPKDRMDDLVQLIPEIIECESEEERAEISQTMRELIFPELIGNIQIGERSEVEPTQNLKARREHIGKRIRELRKEKGWNQEQLAEQTGLPQSHISRLEQAKHSPSHTTLAKLADAFGVKIGDMDPSAD